MTGSKLFHCLTIGLLVMALATCGGNDKSSQGGNVDSGNATSSEQPRRGGTLVVAMEANPRDFDPMIAGDAYSLAVVGQVVEGLIKYDDKLQPQPWLAERIDISPDALTYTFQLRRGIKFHDGTEMDAEAVRFSIQRVRDTEKSPGNKDSQDIVDLKVLDKYTLAITLKEPNSPFLSKLTGRLGGVVSPAAVKSMGDEKFNQNPVGTGPFKFAEFKSDNYVRVVRFDAYWRNGQDGRPQPYLDSVEWRVMTEPTVRLTALQNGDVHIASIRDQDAALVRKDANLVYAQQAGYGYFGLMLTINKEPFDNKALRQAVQLAINREDIIKAIYEGNREPANGMIPPTLAWAIDPSYKPYTYDSEKARAKLREGGRPEGFSFTVWGANNSTNRQLLELVQAQLAKIDIKMNIELANFDDVVRPKWEKGESNAYAIGITGGVDPDQWVSSAFLSGGSFNHFPYRNVQVEELIQEGRRTSNLEDRAKIYKKLVPLVMEDSPYIFFTYNIDRFTGSKKVGGWYLGPKATTGYSEYFLKN